MYTIKQASALTGLSADVLRAWERRYLLPPPQRSEGGYRLYDDASLAIYRRMRVLVEQGWAPRQAAQAALADRTAEGSDEPSWEPEAFVDAVVSGLSSDDVAAGLRAAFAARSPAEFADGWMLPMLAALGQAWERGEVSVAQEHEVAAALMRRLSIAFEDVATPAATPPVLVGLLPECRHEVALLAFAVLARSLGVAVVYLGPNVPLESWITEVGRVGAAAVVTAVHSADDVAVAQRLALALDGLPSRPRSFVGGSWQDRLGGGCQPLGHGLGEAAERVFAAVGGAAAPLAH